MSENIAENQMFIELFNQVQQSFNNKVSEDTPGFRLYNDVKTSEISLEALTEAKRLFEELLGNEYRVEVVEDLDIINVTSDERYTVRIKNINSNVEYRYSLAKFREQLLDYSFEPDTFIIDILKRIEGAKGNTELKEIKDNILDYLSYAIHYKELFRSEYSTIGWDRYSFDNKTRIFKYNYIMSDNENIKGLIKGKYRDLYATSVDMLNEGLEENWRSFTIHLMNNHLYDSLIFAVGISGMIRQILTFTKETNLNVNVCGQPGSGKSTIGHYILSFFGSPTLLEGSSIDTENASEKIRAERPVLPYVLDERMLRFFADSDTKKKTELLLEVFREYEGKEKERLGKQYEDSAGQRIYGPIISSSVESMLETLLQTGDDLGQYRRFIEFNIGKAEDEVLFNSEEAVKAEEIANSSYGYGIRYIAEYMLYRFKTDDNYFTNQFREITELIKNRIEAEQGLYKMKGLTSSSMRFALIILSYRVLRESIVYSLYAEIIKRRDILNSPLEADVYKKVSILEKLNHDEEAVEQIKQFNKSFGELLVLEDKQVAGSGLIINQEEKIIDALIDNLIEKMAKVKGSKKRSLRDYLIKLSLSDNPRVAKDYNSWDPANKDEVMCITKTSDNIEVAYVRELHLERLLLLENVPEIEEICDIVDKINNGQKWATVYKAIGADITPNDIKLIYAKNKFSDDDTSKNGKHIYKIIIPLVEMTDSDNKEEEQS